MFFFNHIWLGITMYSFTKYKQANNFESSMLTFHMVSPLQALFQHVEISLQNLK